MMLLPIIYSIIKHPLTLTPYIFPFPPHPPLPLPFPPFSPLTVSPIIPLFLRNRKVVGSLRKIMLLKLECCLF